MTDDLTNRLKAEAQRQGFALAGICPAVPVPGFERFRDWITAGFAGEMHYLLDREAAYRHPDSVLPGVRSLVMLGLDYRTADPQPPQPGQGRISRYAWGADYHDLIRQRLRALAQFLREIAPTARVRGVVDTAPLLEREFAQLAGLGWIGKNTLLLNRQHGSWFFLAALLTDLELTYDPPETLDYCGTCTACLDACPTQAFPAPGVLDARKCISYLTIELRNPIPEELRKGVGEWLFGCDVCQEVCPWNRKTPLSADPMLQPTESANPVDLARLFSLTDEEFQTRFQHTPLWRAKRRGLLRNAAIVLGNQRAHGARAALERGQQDPDPLIQEACDWALARLAESAVGR